MKHQEIKYLTLVLSAAILVGCASQKNYQRPPVPVAQDWPKNQVVEVQTPSNMGRDAAETTWQQYYPDPRLQALIQLALDNNKDLKIATARLSEVQAQYGVQKTGSLPSVYLNADYYASHSPSTNPAMPANVDIRRYSMNVGTVGYELDFWGRVASLTESAKAQYLRSELAQRAFRLSLIADVSAAYLSWLELSERAAIAKQILQTRAQTKMLMSRRRDVGLVGDLDYLAVESAHQTAEAERANLQRQVATAENLLVALVGVSHDALSSLPAGLSLAQQGIRPDLIADLPAEILLRRPDVQAMEQALIGAHADIEAVRTAFLPKITLTGNLGVTNRALKDLFSAGSGSWLFQPLFSLPLFTGERREASMAMAKARRDVALADYEKTLQQAFREVADALVARDKLDEQLKSIRASLDTQRQRKGLVDARYKAEVVSQLELLDAEREVLIAEQATLQVQRAQLIASAQLYKALAGGVATQN